MRNIISTVAFDQKVAKLGGARAIDEALNPIIEALSKNPYGFSKFETDGFSFRWLVTKETMLTPALYVVFTIDPEPPHDVVLEDVDELSFW